MTIISSDNKRMVNIGGSDTWLSLSSTVYVRLDYYKREIPFAIDFLKTGKCKAKDASATAKQFNMIRDELSKFKPSDVVFDHNDLKKDVPWKDNIRDVITSCANYFTTADGKDLLYETVSILIYASIANVDVSTM